MNNLSETCVWGDESVHAACMCYPVHTGHELLESTQTTGNWMSGAGQGSYAKYEQPTYGYRLALACIPFSCGACQSQ